MKLRLVFFISTISGFLSPDVLTGPSPLKVFSLDELVDFGGCYPHEGPMTVSDAKAAYSADHVTIGSLKSITNGDFMAVISPLSSSGSEVTVSSSGNRDVSITLTCWNATFDESSDLTFLAVSGLSQDQRLTTEDSCSCDLIISVCECNCDPDCTDTIRNFFPEVSTKIIELPWFVARDNSFWLGQHFQETTPNIPKADASSNQDCGDFYCPGDPIRTETGNLLKVGQDFFGKCVESPLIAGKLSKGIFCGKSSGIKTQITTLMSLGAVICSTISCTEKIVITLSEKDTDGSLTSISANDVGNLEDFDHVRIGMQISFLPQNETRGLKVDAIEVITTKAASPKNIEVEIFPFLASQAKVISTEWYSFGSDLKFKSSPLLQNCANFKIEFGVDSQVQCDFGSPQSDSDIEQKFENIEVYSGPDISSSSSINSFSAEDSSLEKIVGVVYTFLYDLRENTQYEIKALHISKIRDDSQKSTGKIRLMTQFEEQQAKPGRSWVNPFSCINNENCFTIFPRNVQNNAIAPLFILLIVYIFLLIWFYTVRDSEPHKKIRIE